MSITRILNLLTILSAVVALYLDYVGNWDLFRIFKPLTSILILLIPFTYKNFRYKKYSSYVNIALIFCLLGDIFLLDDNRFIFGLGAFLVAHLLFTIAFITIDGWKSYLLPILLLMIYGIGYFVYLCNSLNDLAIPVLVYILCILIMSWQGISLYVWRKKSVFLWIAIAVILFLVSDSIIALNKFKTPFETSGLLILTTYWISISLLANSVVQIDKIED